VAGIVVLLITSAFFAMAETAFVRMNRIRAMSLDEEGRKGAKRLSALLQEPENTLNLVLLFLLIGQLVAGTLVGVLFEGRLGGYGVLIGTVGEVIVFFVRLSGPLWALTSFPPLRVLSRFLIWVANVILPGKGLKKGPYTTEEDIRTMADVAADEQVIEREERRLIHSIFEFGDTLVREVMVPQPDTIAAPIAAGARHVLDLMLRHGYSRIPVYRENIDEIEGIVYAKDLLRHLHAGKPDVALNTIMREPYFVPETKKVAELLREMQQRRVHIAIVLDEYGSVAGLATIEDLLEELVGEIADEYDREEPQIEPVDEDTYRVNGRLSIDEVNELLDVDLPHDEWDTVAGLMYGLLGSVPTQGETVRYDHLTFIAEKVQGRRIAKVLIRREKSEEETEAAAVE
jgi:magnesium and cobalt exporter, CNNM family